jgi:hypothetical protein
LKKKVLVSIVCLMMVGAVMCIAVEKIAEAAALKPKK